jgi:hypothetical protein
LTLTFRAQELLFDEHPQLNWPITKATLIVVFENLLGRVLLKVGLDLIAAMIDAVGVKLFANETKEWRGNRNVVEVALFLVAGDESHDLNSALSGHDGARRIAEFAGLDHGEISFLTRKRQKLVSVIPEGGKFASPAVKGKDVVIPKAQDDAAGMTFLIEARTKVFVGFKVRSELLGDKVLPQDCKEVTHFGGDVALALESSVQVSAEREYFFKLVEEEDRRFIARERAAKAECRIVQENVEVGKF